jgi:glyoxylase-like metal-dependent hydrolase (beta-lactamase superfamily II)
MLPGVHVPLRSMFVPMGGVLISPVGTDAERAILPQVRVLVAPSLLHHLHFAETWKRIPGAQLWAPPGFADKVEGIGYVHTFGRDVWPHDGEIAAEVIEGAPKRNEVVFFHRATRTLYTADLVFNIHRHAGLLTPLTFRAMGIYKRFAVAKMWNHWVKDRAAFDRSIERMLAWDFDRIVMAHGDIVERGGRRMLIEALRERNLLSA